MIYIAHRGNIGPSTEKLSTIRKIEHALSLGYEVEIDVRYSNKTIWVGHDKAEEEIPTKFLTDNSSKLWCHCKNSKALTLCLRMNLICFWHQTDDYTLTSNGYIWAYPGCTAKGGILVMPELMTITDFSKYLGICSDKIEYYKEIIEREPEKNEED